MAAIRKESGKTWIEGVRQVTWNTGEMCEFASCLVSALDALGDEVPYHYVMGVTGAAFRLTLHPDPWDPGSFSIRSVSPDEYAPVRRAFESLGRTYRRCDMGSEANDAAAILASIERGVPVIAFGVVGPSDCSLITGCDDGGKTLLGWSTYQDIPDDHDIPPDATGYFRKPDWRANTRGYILLGDAKQRPPRRQVYLDALRWAVNLVRQTAVGDKPAGLAAYAFWADETLRDSHFRAGDVNAMGGPYLGTLCNMMMIDDRRSAAPFLRQIAADEPDLAPELLAAAACYEETVAVRSALGSLVREDFSEEGILALGDPAVRRKYADAILCMRDHDAEAIAHVERCLAGAGADA